MKYSFSKKDILPFIIAIILGCIGGFVYAMSIYMIIGILFLPFLPLLLVGIPLILYSVGKERYVIAGTLSNISFTAILHWYIGISGFIYTNIGDGKGPMGIVSVVIGGIVFSIPAYLLAWFLQKREERKAAIVASTTSQTVIDSSPPSNSI